MVILLILQVFSRSSEIEGIPIFLSAIKEWIIEFESSMVSISISIRSDMAWYRLGKPSTQYASWYEQALKSARLAISIITSLEEQSWAARFSFPDVIKRIIQQKFSEYPDDNIKRCAFVIGLTKKMEDGHHINGLSRKRSFCRVMDKT
ncbi:hypothetical protein Pfo_002188 [Paulownia fortunei]|nr:hypothetical protein Pfo_002188 [Paulownia fortunei]